MHERPPASSDCGSERAFLARLKDDGGRLQALVLEFNRFPTRYLHESWIPPVWPARLHKGLRGTRGEGRLGSLLMRHWGFASQAVLAFAEPNRRIALAGPETLERLALLTGAAMNWERISKVLERDRVRDLKSTLGDDLYRFAMHRAPLLAGKAVPIASRPRGHVEIPGFRKAVREDGMEMIGVCMAGSPPALRSRLALKFPRASAEAFLSDRPMTALADAWRLVKRILLMEVDPLWEPLLS